MKKITLFLALLFIGTCFSQNESAGFVVPTITTPAPTTGEIFRFAPGLMTQLDAGTSFGFTNSRWFSMGRLNTGSQTVYGLRFQLPNRAITMGYQDINDTNPRLQWIGAGSSVGTDLEFRVASSFTSTSSKLVATMTHDGNTYFGTPLATTGTKVGIDYTDAPSSSAAGITLENTAATSGTRSGIRSINNSGGYGMRGVEITHSGNSFESTGVRIRMNNAASAYAGVSAILTKQSSGGSFDSTYGVFGSIASTTSVSSFGAGIYGSATTSNPNWYAGYFNGNVFTTGLYLPSDKKLKTDITDEKNILEKLAQLNTVNYTFKPNDKLNLPQELQHGFLAQNIEEVFPELITTIKKPILDEDNQLIEEYEYKAVNYVGMISILTSSLKELKAESDANLKELKEESAASINELNEKIAALQNQLENITGEAAANDETKLGSQNDSKETGFSMEQNRPNPFTNQTVVNYTLPSNTKATIAVVDLSGKFIREYDLLSEKGQLTINSSDIGKGIFIYTLISGNEVMVSKKMIVR